jgi:hypothetical protein
MEYQRVETVMQHNVLFEVESSHENIIASLECFEKKLESKPLGPNWVQITPRICIVNSMAQMIDM